MVKKNNNDNKKSSPEEVRLAALLRSRERSAPLVPIIRNLTELEIADNKRYYLSKAANLYKHMRARVEDRGVFRRMITPPYEFRILKEYEDLSLGIGLPTTLNGASCIYTATDNYGDKCRVSGNLTFYDNPNKYGFKEISSDEMLPGDLVQSFNNEIPVHSLIFDSYDDSGVSLYNYSRGGEGKDEYVVKGKFPMKKSKVYRYVGFDNEKANGGRINRFDLGGPTKAWSTSPNVPIGNLTNPLGNSPITNTLSGVLKLTTKLGLGSNFMSSLGSNITSFLDSSLGINMASNAVFGLLNPNGNSTKFGNTLQGIGSLTSKIPGLEFLGTGFEIAGGVFNTLLGSNINEENVALFRALNLQQANYTSNASTNEELLADFGSMLHLGNVARKDVGSDGWFSNKAKKLTRKINAERLLANLKAITSLGNTALTIDATNDLLKDYNYVAYGGPLNMRYTGTMSPFGNLFKDGGIYIKPENRGKFTALKERTGKSATWFKQHGTPAQKKMATFELNAAKWKHEIGGPLDSSVKLDNTKVYTPVHFEPIERTFIDGRKYSELTPEEQLNVSLGRDISGRPLELGLEIVSPEFDVLSLYRSLATLPKGFLKGTGKVPILPDRYYRQVGRGTKGIEDAMSIGKITAKSKAKTITVTTKDGRTFEFGGKDFEVPFFKKGGLWYGDRPGMDVIVGKEAPQLEWMPITQHGRFRPNLIGKEEFYNRVTPLVDGEANLAPSNLFEFYRHYPVIGMRNVTGGFPHFPVTGLNTVSEVVDTNKKAFGGELTHGGIFSNGTSIIGNGGTHEENPYQGIQVGVDELGIPNLVELDELIWNDYVFSNRLKVPKSVRLKYKLRGNKELSFADAAKNILKESEERPNDPISLNGLDAALSRLAIEQELIRMKKELRLNKYAEGGELGNLYKGTGSKSNFLLFKKKSYPNPFTTPNFSLYAIKDPFKIPLPRYTTPDFSVSLLKPSASSLEGYVSDMFEPISKDIFNTKVEETKESSNDTRKFKEDPLRYAPIFGHLAGNIYDIFSKPDYLASDEVRGIELNPSLVGFTLIANKLRYKPMDILRFLNPLNALASALRRNIMNISGGNRAIAMAGLLNVDLNLGNQVGLALISADEYNLASEERREAFNRATALYNAEMGLKAAMANAESRNAMARARYERDKAAALLSQYARDAYNTRRSNNLNILLEDLGNLGRERNNRNWLDILADKDVLKMDTKGLHVSSDKKEKKNGGKLNRKKKGGFTYA